MNKKNIMILSVIDLPELGGSKKAKEIGYKVGKELLKKAGSDFTTQGS